MRLCGIDVDKSKLFSRDALITHLQENGESDRGLSPIREFYRDTFGNELIWNYPISDGMHASVVIVTVKEGFISLPYDYMDKEEYEVFELERAYMFNEDALQCFITHWKSFSDDLLNAI